MCLYWELLFSTLIWIAWAWSPAVFVVLIIWKFMAGVPEDNFVILGAAQRRLVSQDQAIVARAERLTRLAKYCGFASLGLLLLSGGVWVYRGIVAVNGGRTP